VNIAAHFSCDVCSHQTTAHSCCVNVKQPSPTLSADQVRQHHRRGRNARRSIDARRAVRQQQSIQLMHRSAQKDSRELATRSRNSTAVPPTASAATIATSESVATHRWSVSSTTPTPPATLAGCSSHGVTLEHSLATRAPEPERARSETSMETGAAAKTDPSSARARSP
jgi:hypothetical protein